MIPLNYFTSSYNNTALSPKTIFYFNPQGRHYNPLRKGVIINYLLAIDNIVNFYQLTHVKIQNSIIGFGYEGFRTGMGCINNSRKEENKL
jgi:hypothetical protein